MLYGKTYCTKFRYFFAEVYKSKGSIFVYLKIKDLWSIDLSVGPDNILNNNILSFGIVCRAVQLTYCTIAYDVGSTVRL